MISESSHSEPENEANKKTGLWLFAVYFLAYSVFVVANAFFPASMSQIPFPVVAEQPLSIWPSIQGINWAVLSGIALIAFAVLLAFVYSVMCSRNRGTCATPSADEHHQ